MQTTTNPMRTDALLAGVILEEYRDLLDSQTLPAAEQPGKKVAQGDTDDCDVDVECGNSPSCQPTQSSQPLKKLVSWNDPPLA